MKKTMVIQVVLFLVVEALLFLLLDQVSYKVLLMIGLALTLFLKNNMKKKYYVVHLIIICLFLFFIYIFASGSVLMYQSQLSSSQSAVVLTLKIGILAEIIMIIIVLCRQVVVREIKSINLFLGLLLVCLAILGYQSREKISYNQKINVNKEVAVFNIDENEYQDFDHFEIFGNKNIIPYQFNQDYFKGTISLNQNELFNIEMNVGMNNYFENDDYILCFDDAFSEFILIEKKQNIAYTTFNEKDDLLHRLENMDRIYLHKN